ncbi:MAG: PAS domain S-box protein [Candidatus Hydrogenedentales bacterium]
MLRSTKKRRGHASSVGSGRMALVLDVEWFFLILRYVTYGILAILTLATQQSLLHNLFVIAGSSVLMHNIVSHWFFYTRQYNFFISIWNFFLYLLDVGLLVAMTGGARSPFVPLFLFLVVGFHVYSPRTGSSFWITLTVCATYAFATIMDWIFSGPDLLHLPLYINFFLIAFCGWIMGMLARVVRGLEQDAAYKSNALESSETTLRAILNHTAHPIVVYGENEFIVDANESAYEFLELSKEKLIGSRFRSYLFDDGSLETVFEDLRETGELHHEMLVLAGSAMERSVFMHIHSFLGEGRRLYVALFHDITHQKEVQETTLLAQQRMEKANLELQRVMNMRTAFYVSIANRLRSPLAAVLGFTDMLLEEQLGPVNEEQRSALNSNRRSLHRIFEQLDAVFTVEKELTHEHWVEKPASPHQDGGGI